MAIWQEIPRERNKKGEQNFQGGINTGVPPFDIKDDQTTYEYGIDTFQFPAVQTRKGRTSYGSQGEGLHRLLTHYTNKHLVRVVGDSLQWDDEGVWTEIQRFGIANENWDATNFNNKLIIIYGLAPKVWDGSTWSDLSGDAPQGNYITSDTLRVWIADDDIVHFSAFQDETDWTTAENSGFDQFYTPDGGDITALYTFAGQVMVFKKRSCAMYYGDNYFNQELIVLSNDIGCVSHKTIQEVGDILFWLGENDVYAFTGGKPYPIGEPIRAYLDNINPDHIEKCYGATDGLRYYLGIVTGTNTEPDTLLVNDPRKGRQIWRVHSINNNFRYSTLFNNTWYLGDADGNTFIMNDGEDDDGEPISSEVVSKAFNEGIFEAEKEYYELHLQANVQSGSSITVYVSVREKDLNDGSDWIEIDTIESDDLAQNANIIIPLDSVPLTHWFRYKLVWTGTVTIYGVQRYFRVQPVQY